MSRASARAARRGAAEHECAEPLAGLDGGGEHEVLENGQAPRTRGDLEGTHEAGGAIAVRRQPVDPSAVEGDPTRVGGEEAREDVEERRLAGAVRADEGGDRAALDREGRTVDRADAPNELAHARRIEHRGSLEHHLLAPPEEPLRPEDDSAISASPMSTSRRKARSPEENIESGQKSRKRVPAKRTPKASAPTGTAQTWPCRRG